MSRLPEPRANHIYALSCVCHPDEGVRYVGLTSRGAQRRLWGHRKDARRGVRRPVYNWMRKHGDMNIISTVLEELDSAEELADAEMRWITHYRALGRADLNLTDGGEGAIGYAVTEERREQQRLYVLENPIQHTWTEDEREAAAERMRQRMSDPEYIVAHAAKVRKKWIENPGMALNHALKHSPFSEADIRAIRSLRRETGATYREIANLFAKEGVSEGAIGQICRGETWGYLSKSDGTTYDPKVVADAQPPRSASHQTRLKLANARQGQDHARAKISNADAENIHMRLWNGEAIDEVAKDYKVSRSAIAHISAGHTWKYVAWPIGPRRKPGSVA